MKDLLRDLLSIPSPTSNEQQKVEFIHNFLTLHCPNIKITKIGDNLIGQLTINPNLQTIALVGHSDVVPPHFEPFIKKGKLYGAGASDMQAGIAAFLKLIAMEHTNLLYNITIIIYAREEGTPLKENGLYECLHKRPDLFKNIDCAIVGEPTDNNIQCGCVGSMHVNVTINGIAAHSARPWNGENALYKAIPLLKHFSHKKQEKVTINNLDFYKVSSITECSTSEGRTTVPETFYCNINCRFAANQHESDVFNEIKKEINELNISNTTINLIDSVSAGKQIESVLYKTIINSLNTKVEAKQAWTDVAQLTEHGIPAFNFGPGQQSQAHRTDEYVDLTRCDEYYILLKQALTLEH